MTVEQAPDRARAAVAAGAPTAALSLRDIHKRFGKRDVLSGVSVELEPGSIVWLGGRNGAGKTTLLRIASGLISPDSGDVRLHGLHPEHDRRAYQSRLGFLSAGNLGLYARLSVRDNLDLFASLALVPRRRRAGAVEHVLDRFGLRELARNRADRLSTGQRQRVRLAACFLHDPDVVLLDEPHASLDEDGIAIVRAALEDVVARGGAAMFCAPGPNSGLAYDRGYVIEGGRAVPA